MKKLLVIFILLTILLSGCASNLDDWVTPDDPEFLALVQELDNPSKISDYMLKNFTYEIHDFYTLDPYELWQTKKGDCDDMSVFGCYVADYHGYITYQIKIYDNTLFQHFVAVYDENIWYSITDCQDYYFGFDTFREIVDYVCDIRLKTWTKYIVYDFWNDVIEQATND